jgi:hypothetical protein
LFVRSGPAEGERPACPSGFGQTSALRDRLDPKDRMFGRLWELPKEGLDGAALLRSVRPDDAIALRPIDLDSSERRGDAVQPELPAARRPQVPHPLDRKSVV